MSSFGFKSLEHALAAVARDVVVGGRAISKVNTKVIAAEPTIEQITALIDPPAVVIERAAFAALGMITKAANDTSAAAATKGLNVPVDQQALKDFQQIYNTLLGHLQGAEPATTQTAPVPASQGV